MEPRTEALARQFEAKAHEATAVMDRLTDTDWQKVTGAEQWTVGVTAHHVAGSHEEIAGMVTTVASGQVLPHHTMDMVHAANAKHAKDFANVTKADTIALHRQGAAAAAAVVRGLRDDQLARSGVLLANEPPVTVEQLITGLIRHIDEHLGSIRKTTGA